MKTQKEEINKNNTIAEKELLIKMVVDAWESQNSAVEKMLANLSEEQLKSEIAPGKNSGVYLLGHLTAASDGLMQLLGFGEKLYPQLEDIFLKKPDKSGLEMPSAAELKQFWKAVNSELRNQMAKMRSDDWFARHAAVSEDDFAKEPHRNKLNVLISRTNHQSYHLAQLILLARG